MNRLPLGQTLLLINPGRFVPTLLGLFADVNEPLLSEYLVITRVLFLKAGLGVLGITDALIFNQKLVEHLLVVVYLTQGCLGFCQRGHFVLGRCFYVLICFGGGEIGVFGGLILGRLGV